MFYEVILPKYLSQALGEERVKELWNSAYQESLARGFSPRAARDAAIGRVEDAFDEQVYSYWLFSPFEIEV